MTPDNPVAKSHVRVLIPVAVVTAEDETGCDAASRLILWGGSFCVQSGNMGESGIPPAQEPASALVRAHRGKWHRAWSAFPGHAILWGRDVPGSAD